MVSHYTGNDTGFDFSLMYIGGTTVLFEVLEECPLDCCTHDMKAVLNFEGQIT